jgi:hypothetical protein
LSTKNFGFSILARDALNARAVRVAEKRLIHIYSTTLREFTPRHYRTRLVTQHPFFASRKLFAAYGTAQARGYWGKGGSNSNDKEDIGRTTDHGRGTDRNVHSIRHSHDVPTNFNATTDVVANIKTISSAGRQHLRLLSTADLNR